MSKLPIRKFEWMDENEFSIIDWKNVDTESDEGYILEVDLKYPAKYHREHSNFPLAPENIIVDFDQLSPYMRDVLLEIENKNRYKDRKLVGTFFKRERYVTHFKNLKLYLQLGMKLTKIHRVIKFQQEAFIAPFIKKCTKLRQTSKTKFEQDQYKKVANCVYGKTIQNARNYIEVKLHRCKEYVQHYVSLPTFKSFSIIANDLVQTNHFPTRIKHHRPLFVGFTILELSKHFMFDFYYNTLTKNLPCELELGMSDTDSFLFKVSDSRKFRKHIRKSMDYSNYPIDHKFYSPKNKAKLGFFKDELAGKQMCKEFVGLKSKCYSMLMKNVSNGQLCEKKVCKGLGRVAINNRLKFKHYKRCLVKKISKRFDFHVIRSKTHRISTARIKKKAISHFDSKRWIFDCGIHSEPYGSILLRSKQSCPKC
jgi:hypothetical protein